MLLILINIILCEYGISIIVSDGSVYLKVFGKIGSEMFIIFEYKVIIFVLCQVDSIIVQVIGDVINIYGQLYCLFILVDEMLKVLVLVFFEWIFVVGNVVRVCNSCGENFVDMINVVWVQMVWNVNVNDGFFFIIMLKLLFLMDDLYLQFIIDGYDWMGIVSVIGDVKVIVIWVGVDWGV